uniref:THB11 n=1 Tax=Chlamydomonas reinhardtii TaxID=3055 RepID=UPI0013BE8AB6|nr:Chain A, THB11 [Chlamydomonas reinhardtii]
GSAGTSTATNAGPLLQRVGGLDVVKKVVELFYRKLYADPQLIKYLHDQDPMHLRAKQSMFVSWLFGPPNVPYTGKSVRIAHLRIIKQRGFSPEDFDLGMKYFEEAMTELGAPEVLRGEVMRRMLPYKDAIFTPAAGDAAEEA